MISEGVDLVSGPYVSNGVYGVHSFGFPCTSKNNIIVTTEFGGVETIQVLDSDYTVSLNADQSGSPGGTITFASVPVAETRIAIESAVPVKQSLDLTQGGAFNPDTIEQALDDLAVLIGQVRALADRALKIQVTSSDDPDDLIASVFEAEATAVAAAAAAAQSAYEASIAAPEGSIEYIPVNQAGDTMLGQLEVPSLVVNGSAAITTLGSSATKTASTDAQMSGNSNALVPTEQAVRNFAALTSPCWYDAGSNTTMPRGYTANSDFNTILNTGTYNFDATSSANKPAGLTAWCFLEVFRHVNYANEHIVQICHDMNAFAEARTWIRKYRPGAWSAWQETSRGGLGIGQLISSPAYSAATVYPNSGNKSILVSVSGSMSVAGGTSSMTLQIDTTNPPTTTWASASSTNNAGSDTQRMQLSGIVPPGYFFRLNTTGSVASLAWRVLS